MFQEIGGGDERFDLPGGDLANHDLLAHACEIDRAGVIVILGEGNFHQLHGGIATNTDADNWKSYADILVDTLLIAGPETVQSAGKFPRHVVATTRTEVSAIAKWLRPWIGTISLAASCIL